MSTTLRLLLVGRVGPENPRDLRCYPGDEAGAMRDSWPAEIRSWNLRAYRDHGRCAVPPDGYPLLSTSKHIRRIIAAEGWQQRRAGRGVATGHRSGPPSSLPDCSDRSRLMVLGWVGAECDVPACSALLSLRCIVENRDIKFLPSPCAKPYRSAELVRVRFTEHRGSPWWPAEARHGAIDSFCFHRTTKD